MDNMVTTLSSFPGKEVKVNAEVRVLEVGALEQGEDGGQDRRMVAVSDVDDQMDCDNVGILGACTGSGWSCAFFSCRGKSGGRNCSLAVVKFSLRDCVGGKEAASRPPHTTCIRALFGWTRLPLYVSKIFLQTHAYACMHAFADVHNRFWCNTLQPNG